MAQLAGVKFDSHFSPMSADSPEVLRFIRRNYPEVEFVPLTTSIYKEFVKRKCLPSMKIRWCCAEFKEKGGEGRVTLVGVRNSESIKRSKRKEVEVTGRKFSGDLDGFNEWREKRIEKIKKKAAKDNQFDQFSEHQEQMVTCVGGKDKIVVSPIIHWTDKDVWEFLNKVVEVPHCELYDQGWTRIGCICCPMANIKSTLRDIERWPHVKEKWIQAIMEVRRQGMVDIEYADAQEITPPYTMQDSLPTVEARQPDSSIPLVCRDKWITSANRGGKINRPNDRRPLKGIWAGFRLALTQKVRTLTPNINSPMNKLSERSRRLFSIGG